MNGETITPMEETRKMIERLKPYMPYIARIRVSIEKAEKMDGARAEIYGILFLKNTRERLEAVRKGNAKWWGVNRARIIVEGADSGEEAITKLVGYNKVMEKIDPKLAQMIRDIGINPEELDILFRLKGIVENKDMTVAIATLSNNYDYYERGLKLFKDEKLAKDLLDSLAYIQRIDKGGSTKIGFIENFMRNIHNWRIDYRYLNNYVNIVRRFIANLRSPQLNESKLADKIEETNIIRHFLNYRELVDFIGKLVGMIHRGMYENAWEEFDRFYGELKKEESKLHKFGDDRTAEEFKVEKKDVHQFPMGWEQKVGKIWKDKQEPWVIESIIKEAVSKLFEILENRVAELKSQVYKQVDASLKILDKKVDKRIRGIKGGEKIAINIIRKREKMLWKELGLTKKGLAKRQNALLPVAMKFKKIKVFEDRNIEDSAKDWENIMRRILALIRSKKQLANHVVKNFDILGRLKDDMNAYNFVPLNSALPAMHQLERAEDMQVESETVGRMILSKMPYVLKEAMKIVEEEFIPGIQGIIGFLRAEGFMINLGEVKRESAKMKNDEGVMVNA